MLLFCNVCENPVEGKFYKCNINCDFDIHPLCTQLPQNLSHVLHPMHSLNLQTSNNNIQVKSGGGMNALMIGLRVTAVMARSIVAGMLTASIIGGISGISPFKLGISGFGAWIIHEFWMHVLEIFYFGMKQKGRETA